MTIEPPITGQRQSEAWWCSHIIEAATRLGLLAHHCRDSRSCQGRRGFPDLVIAGPGKLIFVEVKVRGAETTAEQDLWGWSITRAGIGFYLWDLPEDWPKAIALMAGLSPSNHPPERNAP